MGIVRNLMVRAGADFSPLESAMQRTSSEMNKFKEAVDSIKDKLVGLAAVYIGVDGLKEATQDAIELEATTENLNHILGASAQSYIQWSQTVATSYGFSQLQAEKYGASFAHMISLFTTGSQQITQRTEDLMKTAAIIANGTGRNINDVMERIQSGMLGNVQAINDLGVYANQSMLEMSTGFKEIANGRHWADLSMAEQQQIIYLSIMEQATRQYGDTLNNNVHNKLVTFIATLGNLRVAIGNAFLPILNIVLPILTALASRLVTVINYVAEFMSVLFGIHQKTASQATTAATSTNNQAAAVNNLGSSIAKTGNAAEKAGKQAKAAQQSLAGFDEVNQLSNSSSSSAGTGASGGGSGGGGVSPSVGGISGGGSIPLNFDTNAGSVPEKVKAMAEKVKAIFEDMTKFIQQHKTLIEAALTGLAAAFGVFYLATNWSTITGSIAKGFGTIVEALAGINPIVAIIAVAIGALVAAFIYFYKTNDSFRGLVDGVLNQIKEAAIYLWNNVLVPLGKFIESGFIAAWNDLSEAATWFWKNVMVPVGDYLKWFWDNILSPIAKVLIDVLGLAFKTVADIAKSFWQNVMVPLGQFFVATFHPTIEALTAVITFLWKNAIEPLANFIGQHFNQVFLDLSKTIVYLWNNVLKPVATFLSGVFETTFDEVFKGLGGVIKGLQTTFIGLMDFITGVFTGDWSKAWNGIKEIFSGVFSSLYSIVKTPLNLIIDAINAVIGGLDSLNIKIPDWVPDFGGKSFGINIPRIPHLAKGGITNGPTIAMIGDNPGGQEVVSPLDKLTDMIAGAVGTGILSAMQFVNSNKNSGDVIIQLDGKTLGRVINPYLAKENNRIGKPIMKGVGVNANKFNYGQWS